MITDTKPDMVKAITKVDILKALEELPDNATLEDAIEKLIFLNKVQKGLQQAGNEEIASLNEVEQSLKQRRAHNERGD